jgi:hypothetical protein
MGGGTNGSIARKTVDSETDKPIDTEKEIKREADRFMKRLRDQK